MTGIERAVAVALGVDVAAAVELDGGEVGTVSRVTLADGRTVVAKRGVTPLTVEARMHRVLDEHGLPVPHVEYASDTLLVLEDIPGDGAVTPDVERTVARHLAALHDVTADRFGFPFDSLSGSYRKPNPWTESWVSFYREQRLLPLARATRDECRLSPATFDRLDALAADLDTLIPDRPPASLIHGDVWAENLVVGEDGVTFLDPACACVHAEVELAYVDFVGFGDAFFETYHAERSIHEGFRDRRRDVYVLYPLLEHVRYFADDRYRDLLSTTLDRLGY
jgi:fructosamine-3-kinase